MRLNGKTRVKEQGEPVCTSEMAPGNYQNKLWDTLQEGGGLASFR